MGPFWIIVFKKKSKIRAAYSIVLIDIAVRLTIKGAQEEEEYIAKILGRAGKHAQTIN